MVIEDGSVLLFGDNKKGQCNCPNLGDRRVVQASCGNEHTCLLLDDGSVRLFGCNKWKQCNMPQIVDNLISQISCG